MAQDDFVYGDSLPDAPQLAHRGDYGVGVRTLELIDPDRVDLLNASAGNPSPLYDRPLTVEIWYPAIIPEGETQHTTYDEFLGRSDDPSRPLRPYTFAGRALRDAEPDFAQAPYPLVIISHGYPGSRLMFTYLTENLASKGYVVVSIAHTDSTYDNTAIFGSTLLNRSQDQWFVLNEMANLSAAGSSAFLSGLLDADNTALIGYSMGGYGALNAIGAGYNGIAAPFGPGRNLDSLVQGNETYAELLDERIKAAILFAPWGGELAGVGQPGRALWDESALADITIPTFWVVGSHDDVSMFGGVQRLFDWSINSERHLLIYDHALHNVAPNPPPPEATNLPDYASRSEPVWDERRINNINQHFVTAFLGYHLKGLENYADYLNVAVENAVDGKYSAARDGTLNTDHTYWPGFEPRTALGLRLIKGN